MKLDGGFSEWKAAGYEDVISNGIGGLEDFWDRAKEHSHERIT
jgi:hypothetical protein